MDTERTHGENEAAIIEELSGLRKSAYIGEKMLDTHEKVTNFTNQLMEDHPDYQDYKLYHLLAGSGTVSEEVAPKFDLPDGKIETFIRGL